ncbi:2944_t:CDS:2 [Funneliformis geosporum]|uniref:2944_t:CDS:1 n=1 Tax=Funneliformis geosporum TaxID=1117311 RepID=A0A9W4S9U3_9GLOM|nr:2944_t:CDS:2 [Funneliformis geosporum]
MNHEKDQQIQSFQNKIRELEQKLEDYSQGGIKILFSGKANAQRVARKVKPRTLREILELSLGSEEQKSKNLVIEGDNLLAMATLYQYHGKIDLIIADPPYNTAYGAKSTSHVSSATEYVLVYAKELRNVSTVADNSLAPTVSKNLVYGIQNPFSGQIYYPPPMSPWRWVRSRMKPLLEEWGSEYEEKDLKDGNVLGLVLKGGFGKIRFKLYFAEVSEGIKPLTCQQGSAELKATTDTEIEFVVLDPFGGSGTTGHAVLQLNKETNANRTDQKEHEPLGGGFKFTTLDKQINNQAILQMERNELIDTIIASRIDKYQQKYQNLQILKSENYHYLIAKNSNQEGFFLIWDGPNQNVNFTKEVYQKVVQEATENNLKPPYHVYARLYLCQVDTQVEPKQTLSITIPISLYQKLQQEVGKGKISQFIKNLVEKELSEEEEKLAQAYKKCYANNPQLLEEVKL